MAAEVQVWVEGAGGEVKKVAAKQEPLVSAATTATESGRSSAGANGTGEPALSVISDTLSEEYSSDSGKGGSDTTVTPPDSINGVEQQATASWHGAQYATPLTPFSKVLGSIMPNCLMTYQFLIPQLLVGRLIGKLGCYVHKIKSTAGANIVVKRYPESSKIKICAIEGLCSEIEIALQMIRERFPLKRYPSVTLEQINQEGVIPASNIAFIPSNKLSLVEGVSNDVCVSCVVDLDHIFVQQPTHPSYPALSRLHDALKALYEQPNGGPKLVRPFNPGVICVTKIGTTDWVRAEVVVVHEETSEVTARLVDVGGYVQVLMDDLRQIRVDFVTIPFQSTECRLANIAPVNEKEGWSEEAVNFFKIICQGQVLQAHVVGYSSCDGTTLIYLYKPSSNSNHFLNINEEMVTHNYAKWIDELDQQYNYTNGLTVYTGEMDQLSQTFGEWMPLSPEMMHVPTEGNFEYVATDVGVPDETQYYATDNYAVPVPGTTLSWAEEMSKQDAEGGEEANTTEDSTATQKEEKEEANSSSH